MQKCLPLSLALVTTLVVVGFRGERVVALRPRPALTVVFIIDE
jgi:hypothetical protein